MKAWLLTHNPDRWVWPDFISKVQQTQNGTKVKESWTCSSKQVEIGDRIFLMRTGNQGRGIFAAGHCIRKSYDAPHYDPVKAASGQTAPHIDVEFDWILNPVSESYIEQTDLISKFTDQSWSPMGSGIEIKDSVFHKLELMWARKIGVEHDVYNLLKSMKDIDPDKHDGSYELVRETVRSYASLPDLNNVSFADIDLIYLMSVIEGDKSRNQKLIHNSNLPQTEKDRLIAIFDAVWNKANSNSYENAGKNPISIGMFGTVFYTFNKSTTDQNLPKEIITALVKIFSIPDEDDIYNSLKADLNKDIKGIGVASFSTMAHCLKPDVFPIMNGNQGYGNVFELLGITINKCKTIADYADCCINIRDFRNANFYFKNYRCMDIVARLISKKLDVDYKFMFEFMKKYSGHLYASKAKYDILLSSETITNSELDEIKEIEKNGGKALNYLEKLANYLSDIYNDFTGSKLIKVGRNKFDKQNNNVKTKCEVRDYLWYQLADENYRNSPFTLSLFVETDIGKSQRSRVCIEMNNSSASISDKQKYEDFKNMTISSVLEFVSGSNENHNIKSISGGANLVQDKVQVSKTVKRDDSKANQAYTDEIVEGFKLLIPYYEYIIGKIGNAPTVAPDAPTIPTGGILMDKKEKNLELNMILYGPPGTGKTYNSKNYAVAICENKKVEDVMNEDYSSVLKRYDKYVESGRIAFTTFHQSYGYEDFIEGIKPVSKIDTAGNHYVDYPIQPGSFKVFCNEATRFEMNKENCVFIIDEINRGNISKIFGELITLIESTKRINADESTFLQLPYSKESFGVPKNVYILGTMNTADRSIALMDTALRRRFNFIEMMPETSVLNELGANKVVFNGKELDVVKMLNTINDRIEVLYDRSHTIGHAFFTSLAKDSSLTNLRLIFENKVIPLLQEYFYDDYEKIQLVLGDNAKTDNRFKFIIDETNRASSIFKGSVDENNIPEKKYKIQKEAFKYIESYLEIIK